jgi:hypothetical protein
MNIQWIWLLISLALLFPPPLLTGELRRNLISARRNETIGTVSMLHPWQNWLDLFRAGAGTWLLAYFSITGDPSKGADSKPALAVLGVLSAAVLFQVLRFNLQAERGEHRLQVVAPVFYLCGVSAVLGGVLSGGFAVGAGWLFAVGTKKPAFLLPVMAFALLAAGYLFGISLPLVNAIALIAIPFAIAFATRKRLVFIGKVVRFFAPSPKGTGKTAS